jgi:hypothetical protein
MKEASLTSSPNTSTDLHSVTFSQALADGLTHSGWLAGPGTEKCGQAVALASHSALPERVKASMTNATSGPLFGGLYPSAGLQRSLASKLHQRMDGTGHPVYEMTWKSWAMKWGSPICALRASARTTYGNDCFGVQPIIEHPANSADTNTILEMSENTDVQTAKVMGWPTTASRDWKDSAGMSETGTNPDGSERSRLDQLPRVANLLTGHNQSGGPAEMESGEEFLQGGWLTPRAQETSEDPKNFCKRMGDRSMNCHGSQPHGDGGPALNNLSEEFLEDNMNGWKLNPAFSLWLMGYPVAWLWNAPRGTVRGKADLSAVVPLCLEPEMPSCPK